MFEELLLNADPARLFGIKYFDVDFWELLMRLGLNLLTAYAILGLIYQPTRKDNDYMFTFLIFSPLVFFVCHLFASVDLSIGFAFGLFAVFSILRYRTTTIQVKEMTYLFIIIAIAVVNALATKKVSYTELFFTNSFIIFITFICERFWSKDKTSMIVVQYDLIENVAPGKEEILEADLSARIGKEIEHYEIYETDFLRDIAKIRVYYKS